MSINLGGFTVGQVTFIEQLAKNTGLDAGVIAAWVYLEENGSAALSRQSAGNHDWLNVGYTDSGPLGTQNPVWNNPSSAANATANWIKGTWNDPGFGNAAASIQGILATAGQGPQQQIAAIQGSHWASSGYPNFSAVYNELDPSLKRALGAGVGKGGAAGAGGSGTVVDGNASTTYAFQIGGTTNPTEDIWTGINRLAQEVNWYLFSNGEILYFMDGPEMISQAPAMTLDRLANADQIIRWNARYDNCLALDTPIPTPSGWTTMGELRAGDSVFGSDGSVVKVKRASDVFDGRDCYRVGFNDGTSIVADDGHLWQTVSLRKDAETIREVAPQRYLGVRSTAQIRDTLRCVAGATHRIDVAGPLELTDADLPLDPYVLGYWLGDGTAGTPIISCGHRDHASLCNEITRAGYTFNSRSVRATGFAGDETYFRVSPQLDVAVPRSRRARTGTVLRQLGVRDKKRIPAVYLRGSVSQRLALLQGLMDADGTVGRYCCLCLADERLAMDAVELIRSLGFKPTVADKPARGRSRSQTVVNFAARPHLNAFRLPRKAMRYEERLAEKAHDGRSRFRSIIAVDPIDSVPVRCIEVDAVDHLYLAGDGMCPTHNTAYQFVATHQRKFRTQRRTTLSKVTSPTEVQLEVICGIEEVMGGDVVVLANFGPATGRWIVGDCTRSVFRVYSTLTLVPPIAPISELSAAGTTGVAASPTGKTSPRSTGGYVNPLSKVQGLTPSRIDMGVDYSGSGPVLAIGDGTINSITNSGWPGGAFIEIALTSGIYAGKFWYAAENITPTVTKGQTVKAGDQIGILHNADPNSEWGWGAGDGGTSLAASLGQAGVNPGHANCAAGQSANRFLVSLGAPTASTMGFPEAGTMPAGYP